MIDYIKEKIEWWKSLCCIVKNYYDDKEDLYKRIDDSKKSSDYAVRIAEAAEKVIRERTTLNVDTYCHNRAGSQIIMIGRYNGADYIQTYRILDDDFGGMLRQLTEMERYAYVDKVDAVPMMRQVIRNELKW